MWAVGSTNSTLQLQVELELSMSTTYVLILFVLVPIGTQIHLVTDAKREMLYKPPKAVVGWSDGVADRLWGSGRSKQQPSGALRAKDSKPGRELPLGGSKIINGRQPDTIHYGPKRTNEELQTSECTNPISGFYRRTSPLCFNKQWRIRI